MTCILLKFENIFTEKVKKKRKGEVLTETNNNNFAFASNKS